MIRVNKPMKYLNTEVDLNLIGKDLATLSEHFKGKRVCILLDEDFENYTLGNCIWQYLVKNGPWCKNISTTAVYYKDATKSDVRECFYYNSIGSSGSYVRFINGEEYYKHNKGSSITKDADIIIANPNKKLFKKVLLEILDSKKDFLILGEKDYINQEGIKELIKENEIIMKGTGFEIIWLFIEEFGLDDNTVETEERLEEPQLCWYTNIK